MATARANAAPTWRQASGPASVLLIVAAAAWVGVVAVARGMGEMPGTMGLPFGAFTAVWALMMTAMMLPSIVPFAALYTRTLTDHRAQRITALTCGYLLVWAAGAMPAYALARLAQNVVNTRPSAAPLMAATIFATAGIYQLTPIKDRCLAQCKSPLGFLLSFSNLHGRTRDLRVGVSHGAFCLACCWALMAVLVALGLMNLIAMVILAAVVLAEKTFSWGPRLTRGIGIVALALAITVLIQPAIAAGLQPVSSVPAMSDQPMKS